MNIHEMMKKSKEIIGEENQLKAVKENGYNLRLMYNPSEKVQLKAVKQNGFAIEFIHEPSEKVQLEAVRKYGSAIQNIHNPSKEVMIAALNQDKGCIVYFKQAWLDKIPKKMTVSELETELGYKVEVISE